MAGNDKKADQAAIEKARQFVGRKKAAIMGQVVGLDESETSRWIDLTMSAQRIKAQRGLIESMGFRLLPREEAEARGVYVAGVTDCEIWIGPAEIDRILHAQRLELKRKMEARLRQ